MGEQAIAGGLVTVLGHVAGGRGKGQISARRGIELRESLTAAAALKGVIATGVEHDNVHAGFGVAKGFDDLLNVHRLLGNIVRLVDIGIHRHHEVAPVELQSVASVVEHRDRLLPL